MLAQRYCVTCSRDGELQKYCLFITRRRNKIRMWPAIAVALVTSFYRWLLSRTIDAHYAAFVHRKRFGVFLLWQAVCSASEDFVRAAFAAFC